MEVLAVFLKLGLTSFGGPVAHIGYFRREFVERRRWLDDATFTDLVGLCHYRNGNQLQTVDQARANRAAQARREHRKGQQQQDGRQRKAAPCC